MVHAQSGKWETVGGSKRNKGAESKKAAEPSMATMNFKDPLAASPTMFEGFNRKSKAAQEAESKKDHSSPKPTGSGKGSSKAATKKPTKPTLIHPKEIVAKMSGKDLKNELAIYAAKYDDPSVRLRLLSGYLQDQFAQCDPLESDPGLSTQAPGFPLLSASKDVRNLLEGSMASLDEDTRVAFFTSCVNQLLQQAKTGSQVFGWRMLVQAISHTQPDVALLCIDTLSPLVRPCANQPRHCLPLLWCFEQGLAAGCDDGAFSIWHKAYLCILLERNIASRVQAYALEHLKLLITSASRNPERCLSIPFHLVFDLLQLGIGKSYDPPPTVLQEVQKLYPAVRDLFFHQEQPDVDGLFECLLPMMRPTQQQSDRQLLDETYILLVACLQQTPSYKNVWLHLHRKHAQQSSYFIKRLTASFAANEGLVGVLNVDGLIDVVHRIESSMSSQQSVSQHLRQESSRNCKNLLQLLLVRQEVLAQQRKSRSRQYLVTLFLMSLVSLVMAIISADIYEAKSWSGSSTRMYLHQYGVLDVCKRASAEVWNASTACFRWLEETIPRHVAHWSTDAEPYFMQVVQAYRDAFIWSEVHFWQAAAWLQTQYTTLLPSAH